MQTDDTTLLHEIHAMVREQRVELGYIKEQTTKHNGRMSKAEKEIDNLKTFQTKAMLVWSIVVFVLVTAISKVTQFI